MNEETLELINTRTREQVKELFQDLEQKVAEIGNVPRAMAAVSFVNIATTQTLLHLAQISLGDLEKRLSALEQKLNQ